jgi:hypothetical protein
MTSPWPFLAMIGGALATAGTAAGTTALSALKGLGTLASTAGTGLGGAATTAARGLQQLGATAGTATGGLPPPTAAEVSPVVSTANLPPAAGGQTLAAPTTPPPPSGGGGLLGGGGPGMQTATATTPVPYRPPTMVAETPTLNALTTVPELGQYGAGVAQQPTPTTFALSPAQGGGPPPGPAGSFLAQLAQTAKQGGLNALGITDPTASWGNIAQQGGLSLLAGSPYTMQPGLGFGGNLGRALGQRIAAQLSPGAGRPPQDPEELVRRLLALQGGPPARTLPVYNQLPGGNQFSW